MGEGKITDFSKLIPELSAWNNGKGISAEAWVGCMGNFELAVGYSALFWPEFAEHEGCVFFAGFSLENYAAFMKQCEGDRQRVEAVMNHRHVFYYFSHAGGRATEEQIVHLGRVLKEVWQAKLSRDFPGRTFNVSFSEGPFEDVRDYEVSFWQTPDV